MNKTFLFLFTALFAISCGDKPVTEANDSLNDTASTSTDNAVVKPEASSVTPKVFYYDYTEKKTSGDEPLAMTEDEAVEVLKTLPVSDGNFFGLDLGDNGVVQFMYDAKGVLTLDIPDPETMESFAQEVTLDEALKIVGDVYDGKSADDVKEMMK